MAEHRNEHVDAEILERYAMGRLDEPALGALEEHLLLCADCQEQLDEATEFVSVMREATEKLASAAPSESPWRRWLRVGMDYFPIPIPAMAGAMAVLVAVLIWQPWQAAAPGEWRTVQLETVRGGTPAGSGMGIEGFSLDLQLDIAGLDAGGANAQIVSANGRILVEMPVTLVDGKAELRYAAGLEAGQYWVRLKRSGETVREYSLEVRRR